MPNLHVTELQEALAVEASQGIIRNVKVLGTNSRHGRTYTDAAKQDCLRLYEGAKVNVDHVEHPSKHGRPLKDRFGKLTGVRLDQAGDVRADLTYNPSHPLAESVAWWAANDPSSIGLSHHAFGKTKTSGGRVIVESVQAVASVDIVADPATNKGLFEAKNPMDEAKIQELTESIAALKAENEALRAAAGDTTALTTLQESVSQLTSSLEALKAENATLQAKAALVEKRAKAVELCESLKLPAPARTEVFLTTLIEAKDEAGMKALIEDRRSITKLSKPTSTLPANGASSNLSTEDFAKQLKR